MLYADYCDPTKNIYPKINPVPAWNDDEDPLPYVDDSDPYDDDDDDDDDDDEDHD